MRKGEKEREKGLSDSDGGNRKKREPRLTGGGYRAVNGAGPGIEHAKHSCTRTQAYGQANPDSATVYLEMMRTCTGGWGRRGGQGKIAVLGHDVQRAARPNVFLSPCRRLHIFINWHLQNSASEEQRPGRGVCVCSRP